jgi:hypothetical protein
VPDESDETELERELRQAVTQIDAIPPMLLEAARGALTWRTIDADLAELVFDSLADDDEAALVRGNAQARMLSFRAGGLTIDIEVTGSGESRRLIGQIAPPERASVDIRQGDSAFTTEADELGRFIADRLRAGPISLRCRVGHGAVSAAVVTDWVAI